MPRKSSFDSQLERLNRCLLAWEALRLRPDYREDYARHRRSLESVAASHMRTRTYQRLRQAAARWGLSRLVDPEKAPSIPPNLSGFRHCRNTCGASFEDVGWLYKDRCAAKRNKQDCFREFCLAVSHNPFLARWNTVWVSRGYPLGAVPLKSAALRQFERRASGEGRLVIWVRRGGTRKLVEEAVVRHYKKAKNEPRVGAVKGRGDILVKAGKDFLVLGLRPDLRVPRLRRALSGVLNKHSVTLNFTQVKDMWTDFQIYDKRVNLGKSYRELREEYYPGKSDFRMANGDWYYLSKLRFRCNYAKRLMNPDRFVPPRLSRIP